MGIGMTHKFKNINGVYLLRELFYETAQNRDNVLYTLKNEDHEGFPSLYKLYMETGDITEYRFATEHLGGWEHWKGLAECSWMKAIVAKWRDELEVKIRSDQVRAVVDTAAGKSRESFQAQKYLLDSLRKETGSKRGRPTKAEVTKAAKDLAEGASREAEDFLRLVN